MCLFFPKTLLHGVSTCPLPLSEIGGHKDKKKKLLAPQCESEARTLNLGTRVSSYILRRFYPPPLLSKQLSFQCSRGMRTVISRVVLDKEMKKKITVPTPRKETRASKFFTHHFTSMTHGISKYKP
jgi:hypothetical protein